jgi:hypothetical protein
VWDTLEPLGDCLPVTLIFKRTTTETRKEEFQQAVGEWAERTNVNVPQIDHQDGQSTFAIPACQASDHILILLILALDRAERARAQSDLLGVQIGAVLPPTELARRWREGEALYPGELENRESAERCHSREKCELS